MPESNQNRIGTSHPRRRIRNERRYAITKAWHTATLGMALLKWRKKGFRAGSATPANQAEKCIDLLNSPEKFQSEQTHFAGAFLSEHAGDYGGRFTGDDTGRGR